jgi:arylformamidase
MTTWHDISVSLTPELAVWPDSPGIKFQQWSAIGDGANANVTELDVDAHAGTHVDAPLHFIDDGKSLDAIGLEPFIGPAEVVDVGAAIEINAAVLQSIVTPGTERLLLRTGNSEKPGIYDRFDKDFAGLTLDGAEWLAATGLRLVGIDYMSIQRFAEPDDVHRVLLGAEIAILEGLRLGAVAAGLYELICLPLRLVGTEAAPARAILLPQSTGPGSAPARRP